MAHGHMSPGGDPAMVVFWICYGTFSLFVAYCVMRIKAAHDDLHRKAKRKP